MNTKTQASIEGLVMRQHTTVADVATQFPKVKAVFERLGIDYCCGGNRKLRAELDDKKIGHEELIEAIQQGVPDQTSKHDKDWANSTATELANHILDTHHVYMKSELPRIDALLAKVMNAHGDRYGEMLGKLTATFEGLQNEIQQHLAKEEEILFPLIVATDAFLSGNGDRPACHCGTVLNPIRQMEHEHENAGTALGRMRTLTNNYSLPDDACPTFATLYESLDAMEKDLHEHIHLENNILFPLAAEQEAATTGA